MIDYKNKFLKFLIPFVAVLCLFPSVSSALALTLGIAIGILLGNPYSAHSKKLTRPLLSISIIGLGAGMNLITVAQAGFHGLIYTVIGISVTLMLGTLIGKALKIDSVTSILVTVGTAICGGSAIAAVSPVVRAKQHQTSVALGIVFALNAVALLIFPSIGHHFNLSEEQFGLWSALAIHDTSSVVGATMQYGPTALQIGTTVKLARALWIVPVAFGIGLLFQKQTEAEPGAPAAKKPWFILGFLVMAALVTFVPELQSFGHYLEFFAKRLLVLTLFLIGLSLDRSTIKSVGFRPFVQGILLWLIAATATLAGVLTDVIH